MPFRLRLIPFLILALAALAIGSTTATADSMDKVQVVKIHADWCGTCVRLNPTWEALRARHGDAVEFVILDVTDDPSKASARETAAARGLEAVLETYGGRTGTVLVMKPGGGEPVAVLKGQTNVAAYDAPIAEAARQS